MIATPLVPARSRARRVLSGVVVVSAFAATTAHAVRRWGTGRAIGAAGTVAVGTTVVERVGTTTGRPFGTYTYTGRLWPRIGGVPAIVPLAWFSMALPARETAHAALGTRSTPARRIAVGAVALTAWDLFLDPQMVAEGYWSWARRGAYRGIPLTNFAGWLVTGIGVMAALEVALPPAERAGEADAALIGEYASMGLMETVGFARYFRDPLVAIVGGVTMVPMAVAGIVGRLRG